MKQLLLSCFSGNSFSRRLSVKLEIIYFQCTAGRISPVNAPRASILKRTVRKDLKIGSAKFIYVPKKAELRSIPIMFREVAQMQLLFKFFSMCVKSLKSSENQCAGVLFMF